mmetsp:Transcript_1021/g.1219  ORF Transcript_1021/g.1219 Transcript_1021/m.1219 type:complete len:116 (-) Transcript_1021:1347-1694(-)
MVEEEYYEDDEEYGMMGRGGSAAGSGAAAGAGRSAAAKKASASRKAARLNDLRDELFQGKDMKKKYLYFINHPSDIAVIFAAWEKKHFQHGKSLLLLLVQGVPCTVVVEGETRRK